jgi:predicted transcriptional regulator
MPGWKRKSEKSIRHQIVSKLRHAALSFTESLTTRREERLKQPCWIKQASNKRGVNGTTHSIFSLNDRLSCIVNEKQGVISHEEKEGREEEYLIEGSHDTICT